MNKMKDWREIRVVADKPEFSYAAKWDEACGAVAPGIGIPVYSRNGSDYFPVDELPCWCGNEKCPNNIKYREYIAKRKIRSPRKD